MCSPHQQASQPSKWAQLSAHNTGSKGASPEDNDVPVLPPRPPHSISDQEVLLEDEDLAGIPIPFILNKLRSMAKDMLHGADCTKPQIPSEPLLPNALQCTISHPSPYLILPTHILAIHFQDHSQGLLLPVHGLPFALQTNLHFLAPKSHPAPSFSSLQHPSEDTSPNTINLPVAEISVPCFGAFYLVPELIMTGDTAIAHSLATFTPSRDSKSTSSILRPNTDRLGPETQDKASLRKRLDLIHGLWRNLAALEFEGDEVWDVIEEAWNTVLTAYRSLPEVSTATTGAVEAPSG